MIILIIIVVLGTICWLSYKKWFSSDAEDKRIEKETRERIKISRMSQIRGNPIRKVIIENKKEPYNPPVRTIDDTQPLGFTPNLIDDSPITEHRHQPIHHHDSGDGGNFGGGGSSDNWGHSHDSGSHHDSGSYHDSSSNYDSGASYDSSSNSSDSGSSSFGD